ncbi:MAG: hypothetical protein V4636_20000 [Pseudomonadota bacterium]
MSRAPEQLRIEREGDYSREHAVQLITEVQQQHRKGASADEMKVLWFDAGNLPFSIMQGVKFVLRNIKAAAEQVPVATQDE